MFEDRSWTHTPAGIKSPLVKQCQSGGPKTEATRRFFLFVRATRAGIDGTPVPTNAPLRGHRLTYTITNQQCSLHDLNFLPGVQASISWLLFTLSPMYWMNSAHEGQDAWPLGSFPPLQFSSMDQALPLTWPFAYISEHSAEWTLCHNFTNAIAL